MSFSTPEYLLKKEKPVSNPSTSTNAASTKLTKSNYLTHKQRISPTTGRKVLVQASSNVSPCRTFDYHTHKKHVVQRALVGHLYGS
jgi:hypothetical protein